MPVEARYHDDCLEAAARTDDVRPGLSAACVQSIMIAVIPKCSSAITSTAAVAIVIALRKGGSVGSHCASAEPWQAKQRLPPLVPVQGTGTTPRALAAAVAPARQRPSR